MKTKHAVAAVLIILVVVFTCGYALSRGDTGTTPAVEQTEQPEQELELPDGDCDTGDLYESKPDPDCGGRWLGTPTPRVASPKAPTVRKTAAPKTSRRR